MGMYNIAFGQNPISKVLLAALGLEPADVGRFRDAFVADGKIVVYTRNGGGNREHYGSGDPPALEGENCDCTGCVMTYRIPRLSHYSHDLDDGFDNTYATIYFDFPPECAETLAKLDAGEPWNPDARWRALFDSLG